LACSQVKATLLEVKDRSHAKSEQKDQTNSLRDRDTPRDCGRFALCARFEPFAPRFEGKTVRQYIEESPGDQPLREDMIRAFGLRPSRASLQNGFGGDLKLIVAKTRREGGAYSLKSVTAEQQRLNRNQAKDAPNAF
jgi:hypothetical protein